MKAENIIEGSLEISSNSRLEIAAQILNGMISSTPLVDRTKVNKILWANIALDWAEALIKEDAKRK